MQEEILKDKRGMRIGKISTDSRGVSTIYNKINQKLGTIKIEASGKKIAYDRVNKKIAIYDMKNDVTKDSMNRKIGNGNLLLDFYFEK